MCESQNTPIIFQNLFLHRISLPLLLLVIGVVISTLIPPFQSPDEFHHIVRSYLFTKGQIILKTQKDQPGQPVGGEIDKGLMDYNLAFGGINYNRDKKMTKEKEFEVSSIKWSGKNLFWPIPNMAYYFPLAYAPQAFGLGIGRGLGLSLNSSYRLARFFVLFFSLATLTLAFIIFPTI